MNKFTFKSLKIFLFAIFLAMVCALLTVLFMGPTFTETTTVSEEELDIPAVIYLSGSDLSASDISASDILTEVSE